MQALINKEHKDAAELEITRFQSLLIAHYPHMADKILNKDENEEQFFEDEIEEVMPESAIDAMEMAADLAQFGLSLKKID